MKKSNFVSCVFISLVFLWFVPYTSQLQTSQVYALLRVKRLLNYPYILRNWNHLTDFCNTEPNPSVAVVCYEDSITQLHIIGDMGASPLPQNFSISSFFSILGRLPNLKVLSLVSLGLWGPLPPKISRLSSLEILNVSSNFLYGIIPEELSSARNLQTLILDNNMFSGHLPDWLSELSALSVLSLKNNNLSGLLPPLRTLQNLRILVLSFNQFFGEAPDLSSLTNLQVLELENNRFGPQFPKLGNKVVTLLLRNNSFCSGLPSDMDSFYQLQLLDISFNRFVGPFPPSLLSLPSLSYLSVSANRFTGMLYQNMSCNDELIFIDLSSNLLTGVIPTCLLSNNKNMSVRYSNNCLATTTQPQHSISFCQNEAFAVKIVPRQQKKASSSKMVVITSIVGGICAGIVLLGLIGMLVLRKLNTKEVAARSRKLKPRDNPTQLSSKLAANYTSQIVRMGTVILPPYRTFSLEEIEEATNNFQSSTFIAEGSQCQMYKGKLKDGSLVAIRCLKLKKRHSANNFIHHLELLSKFRHRHLVSTLGHGFEYYFDDSSISRLFLVFEYVPNGTLRHNISEGISGQTLTWGQRIAASIGVAKAIQFLQTWNNPGVFSNELKITDVLLDQNLETKLNCFKFPVLTEILKTEIGESIDSKEQTEICRRTSDTNESGIYNFGVILLEIIAGRPLTSQRDVNIVREQLEANLISDDDARKSTVDLTIRKSCSDESLKTMMEICVRCLSKDPTQRPSIEDILWNLHFAAQVQDAWRIDSPSSGSLSVSPCRPPRALLMLH